MVYLVSTFPLIILSTLGHTENYWMWTGRNLTEKRRLLMSLVSSEERTRCILCTHDSLRALVRSYWYQFNCTSITHRWHHGYERRSLFESRQTVGRPWLRISSRLPSTATDTTTSTALSTSPLLYRPPSLEDFGKLGRKSIRRLEILLCIQSPLKGMLPCRK